MRRFVDTGAYDPSTQHSDIVIHRQAHTGTDRHLGDPASPQRGRGQRRRQALQQNRHRQLIRQRSSLLMREGHDHTGWDNDAHA